MGWVTDRIRLPDWARKILDWYASFYGKSESEVFREAAIEKALRIKPQMEDFKDDK